MEHGGGADLYHRMSVYPLHIPPLRERREDILPLAGRFLEVNRARLGLRGLRLAPAAERALLGYAWPGNVRELEHVIGRAALRAAGRREGRNDLVAIGPELLGIEGEAGASVRDAPGGEPGITAVDDGLERVLSPRQAAIAAQRRSVRAALEAAGGNWAQAARRLGMDASNLHKLAKRVGVK